MSEQSKETDPLIGTVVQDRYLVVSRIGEGGSGTVYMVEHTLVGRRYALKVLDQTLARNTVVLARFYREARAAAAIGDEHIIEVVDMGELGNGLPYMVMELLEGRDLGTALDCDGPLPIERAVAIATQCCHAISEAHKKGILHRDIKPENIFLTERRDGSEFVKILDFGISKILEAANELKGSALTRTGTAIGTPHYMSVEQVDGYSDIDARTDVYAMGVVLFEMLMGRAPFDAPTYAALVMKVVNEPPPSLVALRSDVPLELEQVVHRALAKKRDDRFASMAELAEALMPFAALNDAPRLTDSGVAFNRPSTPNGWEHRVSSITAVPQRFVNKKTLVAGGVVGVAVFLGALYFFASGEPSTTSTSALTQSKTATPGSRVANPPATDQRVTETPPPVSASRPTLGVPIELPKEPTATGSNRAAERSDQKNALNEAAHGTALPERRSKAVVSQRDGQERDKGRAKPISRSLPSQQVAAREPQVVPTRTVTMNNVLRTNVNVTLTCGHASTTTNVSALGRASAVVPQENCRISCAGVGEPLCPTLLSAGANSFEIR